MAILLLVQQECLVCEVALVVAVGDVLVYVVQGMLLCNVSQDVGFQSLLRCGEQTPIYRLVPLLIGFDFAKLRAPLRVLFFLEQLDAQFVE